MHKCSSQIVVFLDMNPSPSGEELEYFPSVADARGAVDRANEGNTQTIDSSTLVNGSSPIADATDRSSGQDGAGMLSGQDVMTPSSNSHGECITC